MGEIKKVTVYCASSAKLAPKYFEATKQIAEVLVDHNITLVYGGGGYGVEGMAMLHWGMRRRG